jgi:pre-rRNA-processing protein TSR2
VQNSWGGPDSASKREWFAGAVADLFSSPATYLPEAEDVEERLLQIMEDEFEVVVDDGSSEVVASQIMRLWGECMRGEFVEVEKLQGEWEKRGQGKQQIVAQVVEGSDDGDDAESVDGEDWEHEGEDDEGDVEMGDAPPQLVPREKPAPDIDDEGFTKVVGKRRGR